MKGILIKKAEIINEGSRFKSDILIEGDLIKRISKDIEPHKDYYLIDANGLILIPGMIDDQVHFREPGLTHKADIKSESRAAVAGGVTSYIEMPNTVPNTTSIEEFDKKIKIASRDSYANFSFMFGGTNDNLEEIKKINVSEVAGIKLFLGSSTGKMLIDNNASIEEIFSVVNIPISAHCEDEETIKFNSEKYRSIYGDDIPIKFHPEIRSVEACYKSSKFAIDLAKKTGARLNVFHISTAKEIELFENKLTVENKKITAEVCAHHLWFTQNDYESLGSKIKWNPAIKTKKDKDALWKAIENDYIDIIASDHAPHTNDEKENSYFKCPSGGPMVQHTILSLIDGSNNYGVSLEKIVEKISHNPSKIFNISKRGFVKEGYFADLVLINLNKSTKVTKESLLYKCGWSPFEGITFSSSIEKTIINGKIAYYNGKINKNPFGRKLLFER
mgnify:CR=1 FL=1